jgi:DNA/RNA-binding domain of Phe-tRNA-synthetase-like protein
MTDKDITELVKRFLTYIRRLHVELRAHQSVLLNSGRTQASIQTQTQQAKKLPAIKKSIHHQYETLYRSFEIEAKTDIHKAIKNLLKRVRKGL